MRNSKSRREKGFLLVLNFLTTAVRIGWFLFLSVILFILVVSLFSGTEDQILPLLGIAPQKPLLLVVYNVFLALSVSVEIIRWWVRDWIAHFSREREQYLLTWEKLRETKRRRAIARGTWRALQFIWGGLILAVLTPVASNQLASKPEEFSKIAIGKFIHQVLNPVTLGQQLISWAIVLFILLSLLLWVLTHGQPQEEQVISVKQLEPVHKSLDTLSKQLQELSQDFVNRVLEDTDEQIIKGLAEKMMEPLQQQLKEEKEARQHLEEQIQQLLQQKEKKGVRGH